MTIIADGVNAELLDFILLKRKKNIEILARKSWFKRRFFPVSVGLRF